MLKKLISLSILIPSLSFAAFDDLSIMRDKDGNLEIKNGNYNCEYLSISDSNNNKKATGELSLYVEKIGNNKSFFIADIPGGIAITSDEMLMRSKGENSSLYIQEKENGDMYMLGSSLDFGVGAAVKNNSKNINVELVIENCKLINSLENPVSTK
ncbi:TPA: hypothetical protein ACI4AU_000559 [Proteus mirabilis]|nr:hypothetical protein [Proteus mirabilis]HEK2008590.1 hypothetical protein [Proteus mirabilis]